VGADCSTPATGAAREKTAHTGHGHGVHSPSLK
jgi:hypothetical protein